jgi:hypothetical protein
MHTALLASAHAVGARGEALIAAAVALGTAFFLASIALATRIGRRLSCPREGWLAGALAALGGPVAWGYLYGSDVALAMLLALLLLDGWLTRAAGEGAARLAAAGALLSLARPEGMVIGLLLGLASTTPPPPRRGLRERTLPWAGFAASLAALALQRFGTGHWLGTSVADKALLPNYGLVESLALSAKYGVDVLRGLLLGLYPAEAPIGFSQGNAAFVFPPLGLLLVLLAAVHPPPGVLRGDVRGELALGQPEQRAIGPRRALSAWLAMVGATFAVTGPNTFMGVHFNRYLMWAFPGLLALAAVGLGVLTRLLARDDAAVERALFRCGAGLLVLLGALSTLRFAAVYAEMAGETWRREIQMAEWIRAHLPAGVRIANAATSVEYLTGHNSLNLHGVMSAQFLGTRTRDREAGMYEALVRLPAAERPPWLLLTRSGLDGSTLFQSLAAGPPAFETASLGDELVLLPARWELLDHYDRAPLAAGVRETVAGLAEVDRLNVCDARDEASHQYEADSRMGELVLGGVLQIDEVGLPAGSPPLADGGRLIVGTERFRVQTRAGRDLLMVMRTHGRIEARALPGRVAELELEQLRFTILVEGRPALEVALPGGRGWREHVLRLPAAAIRAGATRLELNGRYTSFQYWFYQ